MQCGRTSRAGAGGAFAPMDSCNVAGNGFGAWNPDAITIPVLEENWWGDASGPWHVGYNPGGRGDSLSAYSWDFQPWLVEPDTVAPPMAPRGLHVTERAPGY